MSRRPLIVGNWKMHTSRSEAIALATAVAQVRYEAVDVAVCPPFPWLVPVANAIADTSVALGAQDCWTEAKGAFTGAVAPSMIAELCRYVILGHSERRRIFGEDDELIARKVDAALNHGLNPIVCVGEDLETRKVGRAQAFVATQIESAFAPRSELDILRCTVAYEPIWAIGTGVPAAPADAEEMSFAIRSQIGSMTTAATAAAIRILYGGSVTPENAVALFAEPNVDGALVGGASLSAASFHAIVEAAH